MNQPPGSPPGPPPGSPPGTPSWPQQAWPQQAWPQQGYPQQTGYPPAPYNAGGPPVAMSTPSWRWRYSPFIGIMYGPIPVGVILAAVFGIVYLIVR